MKKWISAIIIFALMLAPLPAHAAAQVDVLVTASPDALSGSGNVTLSVSIMVYAATVSEISEAALYMPGGAAPLYTWGMILANTPVTATIPNIYINEQQLDSLIPLEFRYVEAGVARVVQTSVFVARGVPTVIHETSARFTRESSAPATTLGGVVTLTYWVGNTGSKPIRNVRIDDPSVEFSAEKALLYPQETATFYKTIAVSEPIVSAPVMVFTSDDGSEASSVTLEPLTILLAEAKLSVSLEADNTEIRAGDQVRLTYTIVNEGNIPFYNLQISDDSGSMVPGRDELPPGGSYAYTRLANLVKPGKFFFEVVCTDALGTTEKAISNIVTINVTDVVQETPASVRDLFAIEVEANLRRLTKPEDVTFTITLRNKGDAPIRDVVLSESTAGEFERMDQFPPGGDRVFYYTVKVEEYREFSFMAQGRIESIGMVQAVSDSVEILFQSGDLTTPAPWEVTPPADVGGEEPATEPESLPSPNRSGGDKNILLLSALVIVLILIIICVIAIVMTTRRSRARYDDADDGYDDYYDDSEEYPGDAPEGSSEYAEAYEEQPRAVPVNSDQDEMTRPVTRRSPSTDDVPTRPHGK